MQFVGGSEEQVDRFALLQTNSKQAGMEANDSANGYDAVNGVRQFANTKWVGIIASMPKEVLSAKNVIFCTKIKTL